MSKLSDFLAERGMEQVARENQFRQAMEQNRLSQMSHSTQTLRNPFDGVPEAFAQGVYEAPGQVAALLDEFSPWARIYNAATGNTLQGRVDGLTGVNELGYNPEEFEASPLVQSIARFGGNMVGDPLTTIAPAKMLVDDVPRLGKNLLSTISDDMGRTPMKNQQGMITWQGSPHKYDGNLDPTKIGTGEGAQAYGYGHYLAENQLTGESYKDALSWNLDSILSGSGEQVSIPTWVANKIDRDGLDSAIEEWGNRINKMADERLTSSQPWVIDQNIKRMGDERNAMLRMRDGDIDIQKPGYLYKFDLDDNAIANMLDWDAPLSEQPESVRKYFESFGDELTTRYKGSNGWREARGGELYAELAAYQKTQGAFGEDLASVNPAIKTSQKAASDSLMASGIPGIKYYDGSSRSAGEGARNFVVFPGNEHLVKALERNGEPL